MTEQNFRRTGPTLGQILRTVRKQNKLSQGILSQRSHVSIRTIVDIEGEKQSNPRFDVVVRLAHALSQETNAWLQLAGHFEVSDDKIQRVLKESDRFRFDSEVDPLEFFASLKSRLHSRTSILLCIGCPSTVGIVHKAEVIRVLAELITHGLWIALVYPHSKFEAIEKAKKKSLARYYDAIYTEVIVLAEELTKQVVDSRKGRLGVFCPAVPADTSNVRYSMPLPGIGEQRPTLVRYSQEDSDKKNKFDFELANWVTTSRDGQDRWLQIYPSDLDDPRRYERLLCWRDYFNDILERYKPEQEGWDKQDFKGTEWQLVTF
jgi:transcriptional regulator with XRE-family HTH domain